MLHVIKHGSILMDKQVLSPSKDLDKPTVVDLDESEAKKMDPDGTCLQPKAMYDAWLVGEKAAAKAKHDAQKALEAEQDAAGKKAAADAKAKREGGK
jgi:hypothetical protein